MLWRWREAKKNALRRTELRYGSRPKVRNCIGWNDSFSQQAPTILVFSRFSAHIWTSAWRLVAAVVARATGNRERTVPRVHRNQHDFRKHLRNTQKIPGFIKIWFLPSTNHTQLVTVVVPFPKSCTRSAYAAFMYFSSDRTCSSLSF